MKRMIPVIIILFIAFVGSSLFLFIRYNSGYLTNLILEVVNKNTGADIKFASNPSLTLMPLGIEFGKVQWKKEVIDSSGTNQDIQVFADGGFMEVAASKFFFGKFFLRDARVDNLRIEIFEKESKNLSISKKQTTSSKVEHTDNLPQNGKTESFPWEVARLHVRHGTFIHHGTNGSHTRLSGVNLALENLSDNGMIGLHCNFDCSVEENDGKIVLAGDVRFDGKCRYEGHILKFSDSVAMFLPKVGSLPAKAGPLRLDFAGNYDFSLNRMHLPELTISLGLSGVRGGKVSAKGHADADFSNFTYTLKAIAGGVSVGALLEAFGQQRNFDATGSIDVDLTARGKDVPSLFSSLNGSGNIEMRGITPVVDDKVAKRTGQTVLPLPDRIDRMSAPFVVSKGEFLVKPVTISGNGFSGNGRAMISLPRQNISANMDCKFMGVTVPVYAKGSFSSIQWGIDQNFAARLPGNLADVLSGSGKKAGDVGSILFRKGQTAGGNLFKNQ